MLCNTPDAVQRAITAVKEAKRLIIDTETSGIQRFTLHAVGWVFTVDPSPDGTFYIPVRHAGGGNFPGCTVPQTHDGWDGTIHPIEHELTKVLSSDPNRVVVGHNLQYDLWVARRHGVKLVGGLSDTMLNQGLINEHQPSMSLEACCKALGVQEKKGDPLYQYLAGKFGGEPTQKQMANYWKTNASEFIVHDYASGDGTSTWQLYDRQVEILSEPGAGGRNRLKVLDVENRLIPIVHEMIWRGVKVDEERLDWVEKECRRLLDAARNSFPSDLNMRSGVQMAKWFTDQGVTDYPRTDKGNPSFTEAWLSQNPLGKNVVAVRKYETLLSSFIEPMKTRHLHNGRVHSWYNQGRDGVKGTITGRFSSSDPNMQQIPKRDKITGKLFRSIFVPDEGKIWGSVDFSQCEPRLLAHYLCSIKDDNALAMGYRQTPSIDAHTAVATAAGIDRDSAKRLNQACLTGAGKAKVVSEMAAKGRSKLQAETMYDQYFARMPEIRTLQRQSSAVMRSRGSVSTLLGRVCHLDDPRFDYKALNRLLQGGNADIIKLKMVEVGEMLLSSGSSVDMLTNIHDAIDYQFDEDDREVYNECLRIMTSFGPDDVIQLRVPMEVDAGEGPNWAIATYGE